MTCPPTPVMSLLHYESLPTNSLLPWITHKQQRHWSQTMFCLNMKHSTFLHPHWLEAGLLACQMPFPLKTGLFVLAVINWQIWRQAGRYLRLLCSTARCTVHSGNKTPQRRCLFYFAHAGTWELSESCDLWPFIPLKTSVVFENVHAPMRERRRLKPGSRTFSLL